MWTAKFKSTVGSRYRVYTSGNHSLRTSTKNAFPGTMSMAKCSLTADIRDRRQYVKTTSRKRITRSFRVDDLPYLQALLGDPRRMFPDIIPYQDQMWPTNKEPKCSLTDGPRWPSPKTGALNEKYDISDTVCERETERHRPYTHKGQHGQMYNISFNMNEYNLNSKLGRLRNENKSLRLKLEQERIDYSSKILNLQQGIDNLQNDLEVTRVMQRHFASNKEDVDQHTRKQTRVSNDLMRNNEEEINKLRTELDQIRHEKKTIQNEFLQQKENVEKQTREIYIMESLLDQQKKQIQHLQDRILDLQSQLQQIRQENKNHLNQDMTEDNEQRKIKDSSFAQIENIQKLREEKSKIISEQEILIEKLKHEQDKLKKKDEQINNMKQILEEQKKEIASIRKMDEVKQQLDETISSLQKKVQQLLQERNKLAEELEQEKEIGKNKHQASLKRLSEENVKLSNKIDELLHQKQSLIQESAHFKERVLEMDEERKNMQQLIATQDQDISILKSQLINKNEDNAQSILVDSRSFETEENLQQHLAKVNEQLKTVQKELDDTKSRLSRAMGDKLTDNNPNIADLSDKNRPTKISERYQELYDNQWTDAFEIIDAVNKHEEKTITELKTVLMYTMEFCKTEAANQLMQIEETLLKGEELPSNMTKQVKDCRKTLAELYGKGLYTVFLATMSNYQPEKASLAKKIPNFVKECFEICWLMAVQDPPVDFGPDIRRYDNFNKDHYKAYTKSGDRVEYVVWPVLLLYQNGPVLCKGIAQGK